MSRYRSKQNAEKYNFQDTISELPINDFKKRKPLKDLSGYAYLFTLKTEKNDDLRIDSVRIEAAALWLYD